MTKFPLPPNDIAKHWDLDPEIVFLNHGSFGACPKRILALQSEWRARMEREPVLFLGRQIESLLDDVRAELAQFVHADPDDLAFVPNATTGVNTVLRSLALSPGDEIVVTNHEYNACRNAAVAIAQRANARVVVAEFPWPVHNAATIVAAITNAMTARTKLVLVDHITSQTGMILPVERIVRDVEARGVPVLVDGAHAPGMVPLDLQQLGASYYTGNCHKWLCTPKGSALLYVRRDRQAQCLPIAVSHGFNSSRTDRSRFRLLFDWGGTVDPSAFLCVPAAIRFLSEIAGSIPALQQHNHQMVVAARQHLLEVLGLSAPCPETMLGSLASLPLPRQANRGGGMPHPLQTWLFETHRIEVPVMGWPNAEQGQLRISAQVYNSEAQYRLLGKALQEWLTKAP